MDTTRNMGSEKKDFRYWRDVIFGGLGRFALSLASDTFSIGFKVTRESIGRSP